MSASLASARVNIEVGEVGTDGIGSCLMPLLNMTTGYGAAWHGVDD
jgi:hypothetical protein